MRHYLIFPQQGLLLSVPWSQLWLAAWLLWWVNICAKICHVHLGEQILQTVQVARASTQAGKVEQLRFVFLEVSGWCSLSQRKNKNSNIFRWNRVLMWVTRAVVIIRMPLTGQAKPHLIQDGRQTTQVPPASQILEKVKIPKNSLDCLIQWVLFSLQLNSVCLCWCFYFPNHPGFCHHRSFSSSSSLKGILEISSPSWMRLW